MECMYPDKKGLVTTAIGVLLFTVADAQHLPWRYKDMPLRLATKEEIATEYGRMNGNMEVAKYSNSAKRRFAKLVLTQEDLDKLVNNKLRQFEGIVQSRIPNFDALPADAQLGILAGIAWGVGPWFKWPKFLHAISIENFWSPDPDIPTATKECYTHSFNEDRNRANRILFQNSAVVKSAGLSRDVLYYPRDLQKENVHA